MSEETSIRTERLVLCALNERDADAIVAYCSDFDIARMTARIPHPYAREDALGFIRMVNGPERKGRSFAVTQNGGLIGCCGIHLLEKSEHEDPLAAEIGYWIGKPHWGKGYATEAARAVMTYGFTHYPLARIVCSHLTDNPASARVIEKLGFAFTGTAKLNCVARGGEADALQYAMTPDQARAQDWYEEAARKTTADG